MLKDGKRRNLAFGLREKPVLLLSQIEQALGVSKRTE
jgi:hypothetical protein